MNDGWTDRSISLSEERHLRGGVVRKEVEGVKSSLSKRRI